jgi:hypothetical protein
MRSNNLKFCLLFLILITFSSAFAQQVLNAAGGTATGNGGNVNYSVGQVIYTSNTGSNGSVSQGVQQPFEISVVIGFENIKTIDLYFEAFPNPTKNLLTLKVENYDNRELTYEIYDLNGKLLLTMKIENNLSNIDLLDFPPSIYILKVLEKNTESKSFKIIKN